MRTPWAQNLATLRDHRAKPMQVADDDPEAELPPYLESFLAHLRMLVGVPFRYLVPDERLLPKESIRFFYVDRSWTDRLVDGAMAVGKIGTRELALHQAHDGAIQGRLDVAQRVVRRLQRGKVPTEYRALVKERADSFEGEGPVTGFLLRSALVSGWTHMDVRAYTWPAGTASPELGFDPGHLPESVRQLDPLRIERLSPSVMIALFDGEPKLVTLEEPHTGVQFGARPGPGASAGPVIPVRGADGRLVDPLDPSVSTPIPFRRGGRRVADVMALRAALHHDQGTHGANLPQKGSANFALAVLNAPDRQRFEGTEDMRSRPDVRPPGRTVDVVEWIDRAPLRAKVLEVLTDGD